MFSDPPALKRSIGHGVFVLFFYSLLFTFFFSPVLFYNSLLAPGGGRLGDGLLYHLTFFQSKKVFWDTLLSSGFPMTADPQVMSWYPPALLLSFIPGTWNIFVAAAYVMAGCFTYGYVYALTRSRLSALISGIVYGMCGFMIAHLGHTAMVHVAAWPPLIIWSLEMLRRKFTPGWFAIGSFAVACCVLAGHLQIVVYGLLLSLCYAAAWGWKAPIGRRRYYLVSTLLLLWGLLLSALQILPTFELAKVSTRVEYGFSDFGSYSFPLKQTVLLIFPAVFGGLRQYGTTPYFGAWNLTEMTGYVGLLPPMLAALGFIVSRRQGISIFWFGVVMIAFLLALGDQTPLAYLAYHLPMLGRFRAPARHFIEMAFAVSVLAGIGVQATLKQRVTQRLLLKTISVAAIIMLGGFIFLTSKHSGEYAVAGGGTTRLNALPWANPAVTTPLVVFIVTSLSLFYWHRSPRSLLRRALLVLVLALDLASFGWFYSWHDYSPRKEILRPPAFVANYQDLLRASNQRLLSVRGTLGTTSELPPNLSRLWGVPNATGYSPLSLSRVTSLLSMRPDASVDPSWRDSNNQSLNLTAVRYVLLPRSEPKRDAYGVLWSEENMSAWLGGGCNLPQNNSIKFEINAPFRATTLGIVSRLACSVGMPDGSEVVRFLLTSIDGSVQTQSMLAGRDTSEWAYDCRTVKPEMKHRQAQIFSNFPAEMNSEPCSGHFYVTLLNLNRPENIKSIELHWMGKTEAISIEKVTLINDLTQTSEPVDPISANSSQWRFVEQAGDALIYENLRVMPRAWLVPDVLMLKPDEALKTIKTSQLPDGRSYDPMRMALVEEPLSLRVLNPDLAASAQVMRLTNAVLEVRTSSATPSFLITSDPYYPGWRATVDGAPVQLFLANYAFRGVKLPVGTHLVRFELRPRSFYYGAVLSAFSLLLLAGFLLSTRIFGVRAKPDQFG